MNETASDTYPVTPVNRLKRLHERGSYDREHIHALLDASMLCHVAYVIDGQPYCTPTLFWREGTRLYWHGSSASRMLRNQSEGEPVCLTVSLVFLVISLVVVWRIFSTGYKLRP